MKNKRFDVLLLFIAFVFGNSLYGGNFLSLSPLTVASLPIDGLIESPEPGWPQWRGPMSGSVMKTVTPLFRLRFGPVKKRWPGSCSGLDLKSKAWSI